MTRPRFRTYRDRDEAYSVGLVDAVEAARRLGVTRDCVTGWAKRSRSFPEPVAELMAPGRRPGRPGRLWSWLDIRAWHERWTR